MSIEMAAVRSRRALLAAAAGAAAATVVSAIERPAQVRAGTDGDVVLGAENTTSSTTKIIAATDSAAFSGESTGDGVGVEGIGTVGVSGQGSEAGVHGFSGEGAGVNGTSMSPTLPGVLGWSIAGRTGVLGVSSPEGDMFDGWPSDAADTGVYGIALGGPGGTGVRAESTEGTALNVRGKARFSRSGRVKILAGASRIDVDLTSKGGLAGTPLILATLQYYRSGVYVAGVRPNYPSAGKFRIYLNKALGSDTYVAWFVIG